MGEVVPASTSLTLHPPSPSTVLWLPCFESVLSASIVVTSTVGIKIVLTSSICPKNLYEIWYALTIK